MLGRLASHAIAVGVWCRDVPSLAALHQSTQSPNPSPSEAKAGVFVGASLHLAIPPKPPSFPSPRFQQG